MGEYWYGIKRFASRRRPSLMIDIDFSKDKCSRYFSASYYIQWHIQGFLLISLLFLLFIFINSSIVPFCDSIKSSTFFLEVLNNLIHSSSWHICIFLYKIKNYNIYNTEYNLYVYKMRLSWKKKKDLIVKTINLIVLSCLAVSSILYLSPCPLVSV